MPHDSPLPVLTRKILGALTQDFASPGTIALRAGIPTIRRAQIVALVCRDLEQRGLAERSGPKHQPRWRRRDEPHEP
ncbi:hypothetical protein [Methylobacterium durans]|uniref:Uncharacterized protein n=1 Tax=Methylobacterium durans TaxID=2202825 RepID=A0A2U8WEC5_9HYPH|nr:hypothetical protein [Methylobacterium durans]AWN43622.1 hypothetical protein DK389_27845 [Methylobacterium durans]